MEAFEQFVAVALEAEGFVVSSGVKFPVQRRVNKKDRDEHQTHGYEVDLVAARANRLVLATVKSFFGSRGVQAREVQGDGKNAGLYRLLNDRKIRDAVIDAAGKRYGFRPKQVSIRFYVGKFAGKHGRDEHIVRAWCAQQHAGGGPIKVFGLKDIIEQVRPVAASHTYTNNSIVVAMKVLAAARMLDLTVPVGTPDAAVLDTMQDDE